jgi:hypothetical protein
MNKNLILAAVIIGLLITGATYWNNKKTIGEYCSPDPAVNATIDCSLEVRNHGFPLTYYIYPDFQPKHGIQPVNLLSDLAVWTAVSGAAMFIVRKLRT